MTLPGYSADAALSQSNSHYRGTFEDHTTSTQIVPQGPLKEFASETSLEGLFPGRVDLTIARTWCRFVNIPEIIGGAGGPIYIKWHRTFICS